MPLVSAIIPAFNGTSRYLREAIDSVLGQTCQDLELIIVDDASEDDASTVIPSAPNIQFFRRPVNGGQAAARNSGANLAKGQYLAFLDQDDLWEPSFLEETVTILTQNPQAGLVHTDGYKINEDNHIFEYDGAMKHYDTISQILRNGHDTATNGTLLRHSCFTQINGYDERLTLYEDLDLGIRLFQHYPLIHLPKALYRHRHYKNNASRSIPSPKTLQARKYFLEKHAASCQPGTAAARALQKDWAQHYSDIGKWHLSQGERKAAQSSLFKSLSYQPCSYKTYLRLLRVYLPAYGKGRAKSL